MDMENLFQAYKSIDRKPTWVIRDLFTGGVWHGLPAKAKWVKVSDETTFPPEDVKTLLKTVVIDDPDSFFFTIP